MRRPFRCSPPPAARAAALAIGLAVLGLMAGGCSEAPLPEQQLRVDDCLLAVNPEQLAEALRRCDRVVAAFPREAGPLSDRYLLHTLQGDGAAACRDIRRAADVLKQRSDGVDALLRQDVSQRLADCDG